MLQTHISLSLKDNKERKRDEGWLKLQNRDDLQTAGMGNRSGSFCGAPSGARFQRVKVSNPPGSGKDIAEGKGVRREVESEGSCKPSQSPIIT